ncbi:MAG: hypothetical protein M5R36_25425 [Deltaproteobacteria bacterium]|nr:hypothetical protein [Deltaproteobacteria bacterium]
MRDANLLRAETADYVPRILAARRVMTDPKKYGFKKITFDDTPFGSIVLRPLTDIGKLEMLAGVPGGTVRAANPGLRSEYAPPDPGGYRVIVPEKYREKLEAANLTKNAVANWNELRGLRRVAVKVKRKMTLWGIGQDYDTCLASLRTWNNLSETQTPAPGIPSSFMSATTRPEIDGFRPFMLRTFLNLIAPSRQDKEREMMKRSFARPLAQAAVLACAVALFVPAAFADFDDSGTGYAGLKGGYNFVNPFVDMIYDEHEPLSMSHVAGYGGYDFGIFRVGGTLWTYFMSAPDGVWRAKDDDPIDQTYVEMGTNMIIGPTVDIYFDIMLHERVYFTPGLGVGLGFRTGEIKQYDYKSKAGFGNVAEEDLTEDQIEREAEQNDATFSSTFPLVHLSLDWAFLIDDNWFCTLNLGVQTFGPSVGAGVGYHF